MFFTKAGRFAAWIATGLALFVIFSGYEIQWNGTGSVFAEVFRIDSVQKARAQSRMFLDQGYVVLFCGLVLGILTEISRSVAAHKNDREGPCATQGHEEPPRGPDL